KTCPQLAIAGAQIDTSPLLVIHRHALPLHRPPGLIGRKALAQPFETLPAIAGAVHGWLTVRTGAWPLPGTIHREYPDRFRIPGMYRDGKADIAHFSRQVVSNTRPAVAPGPIQSI